MKKMIKTIILRLYRQVLFFLPQYWVAEMFRLAGNVLSVRSCACEGTLGTYEARLSDRGVLGYYLIHHTWEADIQSLIATLCRSGVGSFIDIGANIGLTLIPLKRTFPGLHVIGVEADEENFGYLRRNVDRNGIENVVLYQRAIYSQEGELEFERSVENAGDNRVRQDGICNVVDRYGESKREVVRIPCSRLDTLVESSRLLSPVGIKCDIQGAEVHFLRGAQGVLRVVQWIIVEFWPYGIVRAGTDADEFFKLLSLHFSFVGVIKPGDKGAPQLKPIEELRLRILRDLTHEGETAHCELLFSKTQVV